MELPFVSLVKSSLPFVVQQRRKECYSFQAMRSSIFRFVVKELSVRCIQELSHHIRYILLLLGESARHLGKPHAVKLH